MAVLNNPKIYMPHTSEKVLYYAKAPNMPQKENSVTYKVVCCEGNVIQEIYLKFFSNQRGGISIPI